jgi:hypothetical protein
VISVGDIHYIEFEVGDYLVDKDAKEVSDKVEHSLSVRGFVNSGGVNLDCLVLEIDDLAIREREVSEEYRNTAWARILAEVGRFECYRDFGFLRVVGLRDANAVAASIIRDDTGKHSYRLKPGALYFLDTVQHIPWEIEKTEAIEEPYDAELKAETDEVFVLRGLQRVVGKYDLLRFIFKTTSAETRRQTFVEIESKQGGKAGVYGLRRLFLPVRIELPTWKKWFRVGRMVIVVIALAMAIGYEVAARYLSSLVVIEPRSVQALALIALVLVTGKLDEMIKEFVKETKTIRIS